MAVAADLVVQPVEAVAEAGPERGGVEHLEGLGVGRPGGQLQLEPGQGPMHLPWLVQRTRSPPGTPPRRQTCPWWSALNTGCAPCPGCSS